MKLIALSVFLWTNSVVSSTVIEKQGLDQLILNDLAVEKSEPLYRIEFYNGETQWMTEAEKWQLKKDGFVYMDTTSSHFPTSPPPQHPKPQYPSAIHQQSKINPLLHSLNKTNLQAHLEKLTSFHNRWYLSPYGEASYKWLLATIAETIASTGADKYGIKAEPFVHPWDQNSIVVSIPGKSDGVVVVGAHQDSINYENPMTARAPGADDDGSGTVTILEVLRVLLSDQNVLAGKAENEIQFHWYSAEEAGLLGSLALFADYAARGVAIKAMLQQDMTGFYNKTIEKKKEFGLMMDEGTFDGPLMEYIKLIIEEYTDIPFIETGCGRRCGSDHMSAIKVGYPGAFVIEGKFEYTDKHLHGDDDLIEYLNYDHMIDHARLTLGFLYELAFAKL